MESELKEIKTNVVRCRESKIEEQKSTLFTMFDKVNTEKSYSHVLQENSTVNSTRATDEGFCISAIPRTNSIFSVSKRFK